MTTVTITLEFEADEVTEADVIDYLNELIENDCLAFEKGVSSETLSNVMVIK